MKSNILLLRVLTHEWHNKKVLTPLRIKARLKVTPMIVVYVPFSSGDKFYILRDVQYYREIGMRKTDVPFVLRWEGEPIEITNPEQYDTLKDQVYNSGRALCIIPEDIYLVNSNIRQTHKGFVNPDPIVHAKKEYVPPRRLFLDQATLAQLRAELKRRGEQE